MATGQFRGRAFSVPPTRIGAGFISGAGKVGRFVALAPHFAFFGNAAFSRHGFCEIPRSRTGFCSRACLAHALGFGRSAASKPMVERPIQRKWMDAGRRRHPLWGVFSCWGAPLSFLLPSGGVSPYNLIRFSERLAWSTPQNAYSLLLEQKRKAGIPLLDLTVSNPTAALAAYPHQEIAQAYAAIPSFRYEPAALGSLLAREEIAHWYSRRGHFTRPRNELLSPPAPVKLTLCSSNSCVIPATKSSFPAPPIRSLTIWPLWNPSKRFNITSTTTGSGSSILRVYKNLCQPAPKLSSLSIQTIRRVRFG